MKYDSETSEQVLSCAFSESFKMTLFVEHYKKLFLLVDLIHEMKNLKKNPSSYRKVSLSLYELPSETSNGITFETNINKNMMRVSKIKYEFSESN